MVAAAASADRLVTVGDDMNAHAADAQAPSRIDVMRPWLGAEEIDAVAEVIASGWVAQGPRVAAFERAFAERMGVPHAVATSSCTTALHLALVVAGIGPGDDVVVPSFSFIATANAPVYVGARPVFADVEADTGNVSAATIEVALTPVTRAVIVVDQGGMPVDLAPIRALCDVRGIAVIEDAACGVGSEYRGAPIGAEADAAVWSFHPRKLLTTGEGGMLTTSNGDWAARARRLREHAMSVSAADRHASLLAPPEEYSEVGFNYRMTDLQAAIGLVQLGRLDAVVERRRELAARYAAQLAGVGGIRVIGDPAHGRSNFQSYWIEVLPEYPLDREGLLAQLAEAGVSARRGIMASHRQPAHRTRDTGSATLAMTDRLTTRTLILPLHHALDGEDLDRVVDVIRSAASVT